MALTQAQRDALKELSKQSGPGKSSLPGLYFFGPSFGSFLPSGNYASTSARGALSNLEKLGSVLSLDRRAVHAYRRLAGA